MNSELTEIQHKIYTNCFLQISEFIEETEGKEYHACRFSLNTLNIICRTAKITPKKVGQFVTFWKRNKDGITEPFNENDSLDFYVINTRKDKLIGQFIFPKSTLIDKGIISTKTKDGKRGFRVYPPWDVTENKQATKTQAWQLDYFVEMNDSTDLNRVKHLFNKS